MIIMHVHGTQVHTRYAYTYTCILHIFKDYFKKKIRFFILLQSTIFFQTKYIPHVIVRVYLVYQIESMVWTLALFFS